MEKGIVITDRYFTTSLCYQTLEGFDEKVALKYADDFGIIKPDLVFFLDVKPETAIEWKYGENKAKNFREKDHEFIKRTYEKYLDLVALATVCDCMDLVDENRLLVKKGLERARSFSWKESTLKTLAHLEEVAS